MNWTTEQILALAPDAASAKNGQGLATLRKWGNLGQAGQVVWGECQGSGSKPYRTQIELSAPAFKCSCPSRKFPCKHGLGLFLLLAQGSVTEAALPDWVAEWIEGRQQRQEQKQAKAEAAATAIVDPEAQAKRLAQRTKKVDSGVAELRQWVEDLVRRGLATVPEMGYGAWDQVAARMIDAQAPGLARRLQNMAGTASAGANWPERLLGQLGELQLLLESYGRLGELPEALQADVRSQMGWTWTQEEVLATGVGVGDRWWIVGQRDEVEDKLRIRRIWLRGEESGRDALILLFAHGPQPFDWVLVPGSGLTGELVFYPSAYPQRALLKSRQEEQFAMTQTPMGQTTVSAMLMHYAQALGQNPWLERMAVNLAQVQLIQQDDRWYIGDSANQAVRITENYPRLWEWVAIAGGRTIDMTGEWDGQYFYPLSGWVDQQFVVL